MKSKLLSIKLLFSNKKKFYFFLYQTLGFIPRNIHLFEIAFIHKSASLNIDGAVINNERLEFLGDAILDAIVADYLFTKYPGGNEGFLTKLRSKIVNRDYLNSLGQKMQLDRFIVTQTQNQSPKNLKGNVFEAMIGALYIDQGYKPTKKIVVSHIINRFMDLDYLQKRDTDYKSMIIEWTQKNKYQIDFETKEKTIPAASSNTPLFYSQIKIGNTIAGIGEGYSKKEAEQKASEEAYKKTKKGNLSIS